MRRIHPTEFFVNYRLPLVVRYNQDCIFIAMCYAFFNGRFEKQLILTRLNFSYVCLFSSVLCTWPSVNVTVCVPRVEERLNSYAAAKAVVLSRLVKARFNCLPTCNFLAEVFTWGSLSWTINRSLQDLAFSLDPAHIFVNTFLSVIPNSKLITISNNDLPKHLSWNSTWTQRVVNEFSAPRVKWKREKKRRQRKNCINRKTVEL